MAAEGSKAGAVLVRLELAAGFLVSDRTRLGFQRSTINDQRSTLNVPYRMNKFTIVYITLCILLLTDARASNSNHSCRPSTIIESSSSS